MANDFASLLRQSADALGVDPVDLATVISYETGGTFDSTKRGPTTQWGQHRGLIQFGEPQARKYGVNWNNAVGSQLGADGAVVKYLRDTGVKPGTSLLDLYSAINAGGVGRYGRSDANNGGAPGTVRDKVRNQMAGHREKAIALMGGAPQPAALPGAPVANGLQERMALGDVVAPQPPAPRADLGSVIATIMANQQQAQQQRAEIEAAEKARRQALFS